MNKVYFIVAVFVFWVGGTYSMEKNDPNNNEKSLTLPNEVEDEYTSQSEALFDAIEKCNIKEVKSCITTGPKDLINKKNDCNETPLLFASNELRNNKSELLKIISLLLKNGANPDTYKDGYDCALLKTMFYYNVFYHETGKVDWLEDFLNANANVNVTYCNGKTFLYSLVTLECSHDEKMHLIPKVLPRCNNIDKLCCGYTALHEAASRDMHGIVKILLEHGANPTICNQFYKTPQQCTGSDQVSNLLSEYEKEWKKNDNSTHCLLI